MMLIVIFNDFNLKILQFNTFLASFYSFFEAPKSGYTGHPQGIKK